MAVLVKGKFLYLSHHAVASWATTEALRTIGGEYVDVGIDHERIGNSHHAPFESVVRHCDYRGEPVVCTVRHHYEAWITEWCRDGRTMEFQPWLEGRISETVVAFPRWQTDPRRFFWHVQHSHVILRYEQLERDWRELLAGVGLEFLELPPVNVSRDRPRRIHTPATLRLINRVYGQEMRELGYEMSETVSP
jgi:hypothetical protein